MSRLPFARRLAVLAVLLALATPLAVSAAPRGSGAGTATRSAPSLSLIWSWLVSLWGEKTPVAPDGGCIADPWGGCNPAPIPDNGCHADPWGVCISGS